MMFDRLDWMVPTVESIISWSTCVSIRVVRSSDPSQMFHFKVDLSREWLTIVEGTQFNLWFAASKWNWSCPINHQIHFKLEIPFIEDWKLITEFVLAKSILGLIFGYK